MTRFHLIPHHLITLMTLPFNQPWHFQNFHRKMNFLWGLYSDCHGFLMISRLPSRRQEHFAAEHGDAAPVQRCQGNSQPGCGPRHPRHPSHPGPPGPGGTGGTGAGRPEPFWQGGRNQGRMRWDPPWFFGVMFFLIRGFFGDLKNWN